MRLSFGADPEWFVSKDGKPVSIIGKIGGTKTNPLPIPELGHGFAVQEDNVALEYNIPPCTLIEEWVDSHMRVHQKLRAMLKVLGLVPLITPSVEFSNEELDNPRAWIFGCDPDINAWTGRVNPRPQSDNPNLRSAGGHIHVGIIGLRKAEKLLFVRHMDAYVGLPLLLIDKDDRRRTFYGAAGAMRFKPYGLEYRTPSNIWTKRGSMIRGVARATQAAAFSYTNNVQIEEDVRVIINSGDRTGAKTYMEKYGIQPIV